MVMTINLARLVIVDDILSYEFWDYGRLVSLTGPVDLRVI